MNDELKIGTKVEILYNSIQPSFVGKIGVIYKIYSNSNNSFYKIMVNNILLKGFALKEDILKITNNIN